MNIVEKNKGITLIALIITIVVLLILAGVTISQITGSENAMEKATEAREKNEQGAELDAIKLAVVNSVTSGLDGFVDTTALKSGLTGLIQENPEDVIVGDSPWTVTSPSGRVYEINKNSTVNEVTGLILTPNKLTLTIEDDTYEEKTIIARLIDIEGTLTWSNSTDIIDVTPSADGMSATIKAKKNGTETVTVSCSNGDTAECIVKVTKEMPSAKNVLTLTNNNSPYVNYVDKNGSTILCRVLYNDNEHGLQIISADSVETIYLGKNDENYKDDENLTNIQKAKKSYNNAIENLNNKAESYNNTSLSYDARCVGSIAIVTNNVFTNKDDEADVDESTNNKGSDTNYTEDFNKMKDLGIQVIDIWLASRYGGGAIRETYYNYYGGLTYHALFYDNNAENNNPSHGFRPIFLIKSNVKVNGGDGLTADSAYTLE